MGCTASVQKGSACVWAIPQQARRLECKGWHNWRHCPHTRILAAAHSHVSHWCAHLVRVLGVPSADQLQAQIISRAMKLLCFCPMTPAHRKPPWPGYTHGLRLFTKLLVAHPLVGVCLPPDIRPVDYLRLTGYMVGSLFIRGHSAGSYA